MKLPASLVLCSVSGTVKNQAQKTMGYLSSTLMGFIFMQLCMKTDQMPGVIHLHNHASTVVSAHPDGLIGLSQNAMRFSDQVAWYDYDGVNPSQEQLSEMVRAMGEKPVLAMRNHGMLTVGRTIAEAFHRAFYFNKACQEQIDILSSTQTPLMPKGPSVEKSKAFFANPERISGEREWPAWLRFLDRKYQAGIVIRYF